MDIETLFRCISTSITHKFSHTLPPLPTLSPTWNSQILSSLKTCFPNVLRNQKFKMIWYKNGSKRSTIVHNGFKINSENYSNFLTCFYLKVRTFCNIEYLKLLTCFEIIIFFVFSKISLWLIQWGTHFLIANSTIFQLFKKYLKTEPFMDTFCLC